MYTQIVNVVSEEGLVGLQKLEAEGMIKPDGEMTDPQARKQAMAFAAGLACRPDSNELEEALWWLFEGEYLVDHGFLYVSLAQGERYEDAPSLEESKFYQLLKAADCDDKVCFDFLLDYKENFSPRMIEWLESRSIYPDDVGMVKTDYGYAYIDADSDEDEVYLGDSGRYYNRYSPHFNYVD